MEPGAVEFGLGLLYGRDLRCLRTGRAVEVAASQEVGEVVPTARPVQAEGVIDAEHAAAGRINAA